MFLLSSIGCAPSETTTLYGRPYDQSRGCFGPRTPMEEVPGPSERIAVDVGAVVEHVPTGTLWWVWSESYLAWLSDDWRDPCERYDDTCPFVGDGIGLLFCDELDLADAGTD